MNVQHAKQEPKMVTLLFLENVGFLTCELKANDANAADSKILQQFADMMEGYRVLFPRYYSIV